MLSLTRVSSIANAVNRSHEQRDLTFLPLCIGEFEDEDVRLVFRWQRDVKLFMANPTM